jgi:hypothetical protein
MLQPGGSEREENGAGERGEGGGFISVGRRRLRQGVNENLRGRKCARARSPAKISAGVEDD